MKDQHYKLIFWGFILLTFILACISCNPVKKVLKDENKMREVWEKGVLKDWCVNDSVYVSDTTILLDTLNVIETSTDTVTVNDTVRITRVDNKYITKTVTIRDTTIVTDRSKEALLQRKLINKEGELLIKSEQVNKTHAVAHAMKKGRNKWRLYFFLLLAAFAGWVFRKPIMKLISPIKL